VDWDPVDSDSDPKDSDLDSVSMKSLFFTYVQDVAKSAFDEWLKVKREQQKQEAKNEQERQKEAKPEPKKRSKKEAERAFKKYADIFTEVEFEYLLCSIRLMNRCNC